MRITALEEYGLRCLVHVAKQQDGTPISAQTIADLEKLSLPYAQKILRALAQGDLVEARRGVHGGYVLSRPAERITVGDAVRVLGGVFDVQHVCDRYAGESCPHDSNCVVRPIWGHIAAFVARTLDNISLALLLDDEKAVESYLKMVAPIPPEQFCPVGETPAS